MLFKDLKNIITEADEEISPQPDATPPPAPEPTPVAKPKSTNVTKTLNQLDRAKQASKKASDGVGAVENAIANTIKKSLSTDLNLEYRNFDIINSNNSITITLPVDKNGIILSNDRLKTAKKLKGLEISAEDQALKAEQDTIIEDDKFIAIVTQLVTAALGRDLKTVELVGPTKVGAGKFILSVVPNK